MTSFPLHDDCIKHSKEQETRNNLRNTNILKCYSNDEPARGFNRGFGDECQSHCFTEA